MDNSPYNSAYPPVNQYEDPTQQYTTHQPSASKPIINAPVPRYPQPYPPPNSGAWTTELCSCSDDWSSCCLGCWCPCVLVGRSVEALDEGATSCPVGGSIFCLAHAMTGCGCIYTWIYRTRLRQKYGLPETPCGDCCTDCCCLNCSICQVYREIENRNIHPTGSGPAHPASSAPGFQHMTK